VGFRTLLCVWAVCVIAATATARGPEWVEGANGTGDAGATPGSSQPTVGDGPVLRIGGTLTLDPVANAGLNQLDLEDVYIICITDPELFSATTQAIAPAGAGLPDGSFAEFDSQLYLFDISGLGLLGNQSTGLVDDLGFDFATLLDQATDLTGQAIPEPGNYLLAITSFGQPTGEGQPIFSFASPTEISGPDGSGADDPLEQWFPMPIGACCIDDECLVLSEDDCLAAGGAYFGDGTVCADGFENADSPFNDISDIGIPVPFPADKNSRSRTGDDDDDDTGASVPIGFAFEHFGNEYSSVAVSSNGYLTFSTDPDHWDERFGKHFPNPKPPNDVIAPFWNDFDVDIDSRTDAGTVHYLTQDDQFIVQWTDVKQDYGIGPRRATFQVVLFEGSNCIEFRYQRLDHFLGLLFTSIGIENADGTAGFNVNPFFVKEDQSLRFCPTGVDCDDARGATPGSGPLNYRIVLTGTCFATDGPLGVCTLPDGSCFVQIQSQCEDADGLWTPGGTTDDDDDDVPAGCDNCPDTFNPDQTDADGDGIGDACDAPCPADLTDSGDAGMPDNVVNMYDLLALLAGWGADGPGADIAEPDDVIDVHDLLGLLAGWGPCQ